MNFGFAALVASLRGASERLLFRGFAESGIGPVLAGIAAVALPVEQAQDFANLYRGYGLTYTLGADNTGGPK
jgi:hypothetical protein